MLHNITGELSMLNQPTPISYHLGLRVGLGDETGSLLAEVWEELGGETHGACLTSPCLRLTSQGLGHMAPQNPHMHTQSPRQRRNTQGDGKANQFCLCYRLILRKFSKLPSPHFSKGELTELM